jgi:hypothetical protein
MVQVYVVIELHDGYGVKAIMRTGVSSVAMCRRRCAREHGAMQWVDA